MNPKKFFSIVKVTVKNLLAYRQQFLIWIINAPIYLTIMLLVWTAVYSFSGSGLIGGFSFNEMIQYYVLSVIIGTVAYTGIDYELSHRINHGEVTRDLLKPVGFFENLFSFDVSIRALSLVIQIIPFVLIGVFFFGLRIHSVVHLLLFIASSALAFLIAFNFSFALGLTSFWTKHYYGLGKFKNGINKILSGSFIPLTLFPAFIANFFIFLPFQYIGFTPIMIFLGKYDVLQCLFFLLIQLVWIIVLFLISKLILKKGLKIYAGEGV